MRLADIELRLCSSAGHRSVLGAGSPQLMLLFAHAEEERAKLEGPCSRAKLQVLSAHVRCG